jgi:hypothetical protein
MIVDAASFDDRWSSAVILKNCAVSTNTAKMKTYNAMKRILPEMIIFTKAYTRITTRISPIYGRTILSLTYRAINVSTTNKTIKTIRYCILILNFMLLLPIPHLNELSDSYSNFSGSVHF